MYLKILISTAIIFIMEGCSSKHYFEPKNVSEESSALNSSEEIMSLNRDGATLRNGVVLDKHGRLRLTLENGYVFINRNSNGTLIANSVGEVKLIKNSMVKQIQFPKALIAGTVIDNLLIYLLRDNSFGIYDLSQNSIVYNNKAQKTYSIDMRVTNPIQVDDLVVVPLLNGKIAILDRKNRKLFKEIVVSTQSSLNNIIFLDKLNNSLIVATPHKLIAISGNGRKEFEDEISEVAIDGNSIFVFSKDGKISKLDESLTVQDEKKFRFAHFSVATLYNGRVYALDKQGYLIVSNQDFTKYKIYEFPEVENHSFVSGGKIYYGENVIDLDKLNFE